MDMHEVLTEPARTDEEAARSIAAGLNHPWRRTNVPLDRLVTASKAVHAVHARWARTVVNRHWSDCYECQVYAVRALEAVE